MKKLNYKKIRFSPEIEVEFPKLGEDDIESILYGLGNPKFDLKGWDIDEEASLDNGLEYKPSNENHLYFNKKSLDQIKKLLEKIKKNGGKIKQKCGLHIHIDVSKLSDIQKYDIIKRFMKKQSFIIKKFNVREYRLNIYCSELPEDILNNEFKNIHERIGGHKQYALESSFFNTLEFRLFNGTLSYKTMVKNIKWLLKFVAGVNEK